MSIKFHPLLQKKVRKFPLVLVVDDNQDNLILAGATLDLMGIKPLIVRDGNTAIDIAIDRLPDLILLDIVMPDIDGITISRMLKKHPRTNHIPIVAVTGLTCEHHKEEIRGAGCDDYICKPYLIEDFESMVASFLKPNATA